MFRFQADADFNGLVIRAIRRLEPTLDVQTAHDLGLKGVEDQRVLQLAAAEGRILLTHDKQTMPVHYAEFLAAGNESPGVILVDQAVPIGDAAREIVRVWSRDRPERWAGLLRWLEV